MSCDNADPRGAEGQRRDRHDWDTVFTMTTAPLLDLWYFACLAEDLRPGRLTAKRFLGEPIVIGRTRAGNAFALRDICPHRAALLSAGRVLEAPHAQNGARDSNVHAEVECPYHGWRFRTHDGVCTHIPALPSDSDFEHERIRVRRYPLRERDGLVWVYMSSDPRFDGDPDVEPPDIAAGAEGPVGGGQIKFRTRETFKAHVDQAVIGLMDPAHGPYVHQSWFWRKPASAMDKTKAYEPSELGFTMVAHPPSSNSAVYQLLGGAPKTEISFRLPGVRVETITNDRHTVISATFVTPLDDATSETTHVIYWDTPVLSVLRPILAPLGRAFLRQDAGILALQQEGLAHDPNLLLVDDADALAKWYLRLKKEWVAARAENRAFVNPLEPATLRWRT